MSCCLFFASLHCADSICILVLSFRLPTSNGINWNIHWLLRFCQECLTLIVILLSILNRWSGVTHLSLESRNGHLQQLVLSLGLKNLRLQKVPLLLHIGGFGLPIFYLLSLVVFVLLHFDLVLLDALNGLFQVLNFLIFQIVIGVLVVQLFDKITKFSFLSFDVNIIAFEIFIFLFG